MKKYIGIPYVLGGETEDGLDCYSFVKYYLESERGIALPEIKMYVRNILQYCREIEDNNVRGEFVQVDEPTEDCVVLMARGVVACHTGIWCNGGILHCLEKKGVVFTTEKQLQELGLKVEGYYVHSSLYK